jgi:hypothetical protein
MLSVERLSGVGDILHLVLGVLHRFEVGMLVENDG